MKKILDYRDHVGSRPDKFYKSTLFQGQRLLLGINCLEPGQSQAVHAHDDQDKFYYVIEGEGSFTLGEESHAAGPGKVILAPAGLPHGVHNSGAKRLTVLVGIAPAPGS